ncbi:hypothetical protein [Timonella sp. A28]|uniref:hypothetical protein n=1 Tax=Timonella sp. A28 TaxID=3442640 RepID=UPI003EBC6549
MFSQISASRSLRAVAGAFVAGGLVFGTAACAPSTTDLYYAASDGTRATLDSKTLEVINLMVLTSGEDGKAVLLGAVHNKTEEDNVAQLSADDGSINLTIPLAGEETINLYTDEDKQVTFSGFSPKPGSTIDVTFSDNAGSSKVVHVPVFDGTLPEYKDFAPTATS